MDKPNDNADHRNTDKKRDNPPNRYDDGYERGEVRCYAFVISGLFCARRPRLLAQQAIHTLLHEPILPTPNAFLCFACRSNNSHRSKSVAAQQNDVTSPDMLFAVRPDEQ